MKKNIFCILISMIIMLLIPGIAVAYVKPEDSLAAMLIMFFLINPIATVGVGIFSGKNVSTAWFQPLLLSVLCIIGSMIFFNMDISDTLFYAMIYLGLGYVVMLVASFFAKRNKAKYAEIPDEDEENLM